MSEHGGSAVVELIPSNSTFRIYPTSIPNNQFSISAVATLAIDSQGQLWFVEHFANKVGRLDPTTDTMEEFQIPSSQPAYSVLNALDSEGNFWFTEFGSDQIGEIQHNATSPLQTKIQFADGNQVSSGNTIDAQITITNSLSIPVSVSLNTTSSFTATGLTSPQQISLNSSTITLPANGQGIISAKITPNSTQETGIYSVGIVSSYENSSTVGIALISVKGQFNLAGWISSNYQVVLIAVIIVLAVIYGAISRRPKPSRRKANR